jgi:hypothetical protein
MARSRSRFRPSSQAARLPGQTGMSDSRSGLRFLDLGEEHFQNADRQGHGQSVQFQVAVCSPTDVISAEPSGAQWGARRNRSRPDDGGGRPTAVAKAVRFCCLWNSPYLAGFPSACLRCETVVNRRAAHGVCTHGTVLLWAEMGAEMGSGRET